MPYFEKNKRIVSKNLHTSAKGDMFAIVFMTRNTSYIQKSEKNLHKNLVVPNNCVNTHTHTHTHTQKSYTHTRIILLFI
ncbi:hypothetical protein D1003_10725 [Riemerella anatipestifer]|nr:hypothetical protein [Riemerella anatipestifer]